jgi:HlyD family secretion protein
MTERRRLWLSLIVAGAIVLLVVIVRMRRGPTASVREAAVTRGTLDVWIESNGKVDPVSPHIFRSRLATFVSSVDVVEGEHVERGQRLLTLDDTDARAQLAKAREDLVQAQEELRVARAGGPPAQVAEVDADLQRTRTELAQLRKKHDALQALVSQQAATRDELDENALAIARAEASERTLEAKRAALRRTTTVDVRTAQLRVSEAQASIRALESQVQASEIRAPIEGTVYLVPVRAGSYVQVGDELADLADLHDMQVEAYVDEPDVGKLAIGQPVEITWDAAPAQVWAGRTERLPKAIVARGNRNVGRVLCSVANDRTPQLLPNVSVNVRIRVAQRTNVLLVPRGAVRGEGSDRYVFLVENGRLKRQAIQVGTASLTEYEVVSGIGEGQHVAVSADVEMQDGMPVQVLSGSPS